MDGEQIQKLREHDENLRKMKCEELWRACQIPLLHRKFVEARTKVEKDRKEVLDTLIFALGTGFIYGIHADNDKGKTQVGAWLCRIACNRGKSAMYIRVADLFVGLHAAITNEHGSVLEKARADLCIPCLLVLDEFGKYKSDSTFAPQELENILDKRHTSNHDTLILTNLRLEPFRDRLGPGICSRIKDGGGFIHKDGPSFRGT